MLRIESATTSSCRAADMAANPPGCRPAAYARGRPEQTVLDCLVDPLFACQMVCKHFPLVSGDKPQLLLHPYPSTKARQLFRFKARQGKTICEMVIWQLPERTSERPPGLKHRLFCGHPGECAVRYDNGRAVIIAKSGEGEQAMLEDRLDDNPAVETGSQPSR